MTTVTARVERRHSATPAILDAPAIVQEVLDALSGRITTLETAATLVHGGVAAFGAVGGALLMLTEDRQAVRVIHSVGRTASSLQARRRFPLTAESPISEVIQSHQDVWLPVGEHLSRRYPDLLPDSHARRWAVLPLLVGNVVLGAVAWSFGERELPYFEAREQVCLRAMAHAGGDALFRSVLFGAERAAGRAAGADHALAARQDFVAATSHELRTPLSHIKGFVSTLRAKDVVWDQPTRDEFLADIEQETDRLAHLVDDLLDMSRMQSGIIDLSARTLTTPTALITAGVNRVRSLITDHPVDVQIPDGVPCVRVEASQIERVVANLLEHAAKYSPPGMPIGIVIQRLRREVVHFRVEDHGLGVPPEHAERIFEPFFREESGSYPAQPGTGLGLAICRGIVRAHGGRIWVEPRPGGGAAFVFTLPVATTGVRLLQAS